MAIGGWIPAASKGILYGISPGLYETTTERTVYVFSDRLKDEAVDNFDNPQDAYEYFVKAVADTASHESGHSYGLEHQSQFHGAADEYRPSWSDEHGERSAIMGRPFKENGDPDARSLWTLGVNRLAKVQDDLKTLEVALNASYLYNSGLRPDDVVDSGYRPLGGGDGGNFHVSGTIGLNAADWSVPDEDWYGFFNPGGPMHFSLSSPAGKYGNLHAKMELYAAHPTPDGLGFDQLIHVTTVEASANSFGSINYPPGNYLLLVTSTGGYGNLGHYELDVLVPGMPGIHVPTMPGQIVDVSGLSIVPELGWAYLPQLAMRMAMDPVPVIAETAGIEELEAPALKADFERNGFIDGNDFLAWQRGLGSTSATTAAGDADSDEIVDAYDLLIWQSEFGLPTFEAAADQSPELASVLEDLSLVDAPVDESDLLALETHLVEYTGDEQATEPRDVDALAEWEPPTGDAPGDASASEADEEYAELPGFGLEELDAVFAELA